MTPMKLEYTFRRDAVVIVATNEIEARAQLQRLYSPEPGVEWRLMRVNHHDEE